MSGIQDTITFENLTFAYPKEDENEKDTFVFQNMSGTIPLEKKGELVSIIGPNGSGKSTLMLLISGRLKPQEGSCTFLGNRLCLLEENQKNLLASFIYQNMEFENEDSVANLLTQVYKTGNYRGKAKAIKSESDFLSEVIDVLELTPVLQHKLTALSKGEIQRVLIAFSLLYGSASVFMDEPLFALEPRQMENTLLYLKEYCEKTGSRIFISIHDLDLTRKFADKVLLLFPNHDMSFGSPDEVMTNEDLEKAYSMPASMLRHHESLTRESLSQTARAFHEAQKK